MTCKKESYERDRFPLNENYKYWFCYGQFKWQKWSWFLSLLSLSCGTVEKYFSSKTFGGWPSVKPENSCGLPCEFTVNFCGE